jgi:protein-S-isoprenylcysteine O-methyltransferase Ste14
MNSENLRGHNHRRHEGREDLVGEHRIGDTLQLVFLVLFLAIWISDSFFLHYSTFLSERIPNYIRTSLGIVILVIAGLLSWRGMRKVFGEVRDTPQVITGGVFSIIRHPIYLGCILTYLGMICFSMSLASAALWVVIVVFYWYISRYEEKLLIDRFGDEYRDYRKKVPMLFPLKLN